MRSCYVTLALKLGVIVRLSWCVPKKKNYIGTHHSLLQGVIIPRSTAWLPLLHQGGSLGFPRVFSRPSSRHECLSLGNQILSPAGRKYLGTPTPSHLSEEADQSVSHEWSSSSARWSEWRIPLSRLTGKTFSTCFQHNLVFFSHKSEAVACCFSLCCIVLVKGESSLQMSRT